MNRLNKVLLALFLSFVSPNFQCKSEEALPEKEAVTEQPKKISDNDKKVLSDFLESNEPASHLERNAVGLVLDEETTEMRCNAFFITPKGHLLTAGHCLQMYQFCRDEGCEVYGLKSQGKKEKIFPLKILKYDPYLDLALLRTKKSPPKNIAPLSLRKEELSDNTVVHFNSALPFSAGTVSRKCRLVGRKAYHRDKQTYYLSLKGCGFRPGKSGSMITDRQGRLVGIASRIEYQIMFTGGRGPARPYYQVTENIAVSTLSIREFMTNYFQSN